MPIIAPNKPRFEDHAEHVAEIVRCALEAASPRRCVSERAPADIHGLRCRLIAVGKASVEMTVGLVRDVRADVTEGIVIGPPGTGEAIRAKLPDVPAIFGLDARHPIPSRGNVRAARCAADIARRCATDRTPLVFLLSGGASAHLALPREDKHVRVTLAEIQDLTSALLRAGATIHQLNTVRKRLEVLKGGGLARLAAPARVEGLVLSDVVGDDLSVIGSGPVTPDLTRSREAAGVIESMGLAERFSRIVVMLCGDVTDEVDGAVPHEYDWVRTTIVGNNEMALHAASDAAMKLGFEIASVESGVQGESCEVGRRLAAATGEARARSTRPVVVLMGGETTVRVRGDGVGGRNQELALAAAIELERVERALVASFGTDGIDGPTDSAGAWATGGTSGTCAIARARGVDPVAALERNDSHTFFQVLRTHIRTGPTGTNVNDIAFGLAY